MSSEISNKVLAKIRKLMSLANGNAEGGEHERDTAMKMALNLLAKHNLSMSDLKETDQEGRKHEAFESDLYAWIRGFLVPLASMFFCKVFITKLSGTSMRVTFVGRESNVITAREMTEYVTASIKREATRKARNNGGGAFERSFCNGAGRAIAERCYEFKRAEEAASKAAPGTGLVLASLYAQEATKNELYIAEGMGISLVHKKASGTISRSEQAYNAGKDFGRNINLSKQIT